MVLGSRFLIPKFFIRPEGCKPQRVNREDASCGVPGGLGRMPGKAGKQGSGRSLELSWKWGTIPWSTFGGSAHLEGPECRRF